MSSISDFLTGKLLVTNPAFAHMYFKNMQDNQFASQQQGVGSVLSNAIGSDPTGFAAPQQQQQVPMQENVSQAQPQQQYDFGPYTDAILAAAQQTGLDPNEIYQIAVRESGMDPNAQSPTGPQGIMQLSAAAAKDVGLDPDERFNPVKNILAGANYFKSLKEEFGDKAHLAYHDGPTAVRNGHASEEGLRYNASFSEPIFGQPHQLQMQAQGGSKFLPRPTIGGEGLLADDMDPVRRSYYHFIKKLVDSGDPYAIEMAQKLFEQQQEYALKSIDPTDTQKNMALTNLVPGSPEFSSAVLASMTKPATQINMGDSWRPSILTPSEQENFLGRTFAKGEPQPRWDKNGDIKVGAPQGTTEDQGKAAQFAAGLTSALNNILSAPSKSFDIAKNPRDFAGSILEDTGIPGISAIGTSMQSEAQQLYGQSKKEAIINLTHAMTGSGFSSDEEKMKTIAYIPNWGDSEPARLQKTSSLAVQLESLVHRAGAQATPELREAAKVVRQKLDSMVTAAKVKPSAPVQQQQAPVPVQQQMPALPSLPDGWSWSE